MINRNKIPNLALEDKEKFKNLMTKAGRLLYNGGHTINDLHTPEGYHLYNELHPLILRQFPLETREMKGFMRSILQIMGLLITEEENHKNYESLQAINLQGDNIIDFVKFK